MADLVLSLDTSGARCAVALARGPALLARRDPAIGRGHAEALTGLVGETLAEAGAAYGDLACIAVVIGPGSFTGLRVGLAAAKGLSLALGIPLVGIDALEALAEPHRGAGAVLAAQDAKRGELHVALYSAEGAPLVPPCAVAPGDLPALLAPHPRPVRLVGSGAGLAAAALAPFEGALAATDGLLDIAAVARIAAGREAGPPPRPLYLRGADAKPQTGVLPRMPAASAILP